MLNSYLFLAFEGVHRDLDSVIQTLVVTRRPVVILLYVT